MKVIFFVFLFLLAFLLRTYKLDIVPLGLSEDEAAIGYNAYSILKTLRDENGNFLPIYFESFGDYKLGLPVYLTIPFIALGDLNEFFVRFPAAFFGSLSVILIYFLGEKLVNKRVGFFSSLLLAISPWHLQLSRYDTPTSLAIFLIIIETVILASATFKNQSLLLFLILVLISLTHPAAWLVGSVLFLFWFFKRLYKKSLSRWYLIFTVFILLFIVALIKPSLANFYLKKSFFTEVGFNNKVNQLRGFSAELFPDVLGKIYQNKYVLSFDQITKNYLRQFDFYYLFSKANFEEKFVVTNFGKFYGIELIFAIIGLYSLLRNRLKFSFFLTIFLLASPLPGLLDLKPRFDQTLFFLMIPFYILSAYGISLFLKKIKFNLPGFSLILFLGFLYLSFIAVFVHYYFIHYPYVSLKNWGYGYKDLVARVKELEDGYDRVIVSDRVASKPYIYYLFYGKIDPLEYQNSQKERGGSIFIATTKYKNIEFRSINKEEDHLLKKTLLAGLKDEIKDKNKVCADNLGKCINYYEEIKTPNKDLEYKLIGLWNLENI